jgi:hypothetical protein
MLYKCYLKQGTVYVPTVVKLKTAVYMDVEPIAVVPLANTAGLRQAFLDVIARKNDSVYPSREEIRGRPVLLKYTGDKSWSAFQRGAFDWHINENDGNYQIVGYRTNQKGYWEQDPNQKNKFPPGTPVDDVIDRMIAILQEATARRSRGQRVLKAE